MPNIKFIPGKTKARPEAVKFKLANFINPAKLPPVPKHFGHEGFTGAKDWGMLGNDFAGDCVIAQMMHAQMLLCAEAGAPPKFTTKNAIDTYSAITGYDPSQTDAQGNNPTDQGTDMKEAASYWRKTGIKDSTGKVHKIEAYLGLTLGTAAELWYALWLGGVVGSGIQFPSSAMDQFNTGKPWRVVRGASNEGGHAIALVARRTTLENVTWGQIQNETLGFYHKYTDENLVYFTKESLVNNKSPEGFDAQGLINALKQLK